jgi:hypothetical protein
MANTSLDIANMALGLLTEAPIDSLDDDDKNARLIGLHFDVTREAELLSHEWVFSILSADIEPAETGWASYGYSYELPPDCLRPLPVTESDDPDTQEIDWRREGDTILTRSGGTRRIRYIGNLVDPGDWDALFTQVLVSALAIKIAHAITGKASMIEVAQAAYDRALRSALRVNAVQKRGRAVSGTWSQARGDGFGWSREATSGHGYGGWR